MIVIPYVNVPLGRIQSVNFNVASYGVIRRDDMLVIDVDIDDAES